MHLTLAPLGNFDIGAVVAVAVAFVAYRTGALNGAGACAAFGVGTATFGALGAPGAAVLLTFFVSSVALSRIGRARKRTALREVAKDDVRDAPQVLANGGVAALCALAALWLTPRYTFGFAAAFAAATADTWATEIGTLLGGQPRSILTYRRVPAGLSGGVTWAGSLASVVGALTVAAVAVLVFPLSTLLPVVAGGAAGAFADSLLGASLQALRYCPFCRCATEREPHHCGANTRRLRGLQWVGNDAVNFAATATGAAVALILAPR